MGKQANQREEQGLLAVCLLLVHFIASVVVVVVVVVDNVVDNVVCLDKVQ